MTDKLHRLVGALPGSVNPFACGVGGIGARGPKEASVERQVLVELDPTVAIADESSVQEQFNATQSEAFRTRELLKMLSNKELAVQLSPEQSASFSLSSFTPALQTAVLAQLRSEQLDIRAKHAKFNAEISRRQAGINTEQASLGKLQTTIPMAHPQRPPSPGHHQTQPIAG